MHKTMKSPLFFRLLGGATLFSLGVATTLTLVSRKSSTLESTPVQLTSTPSTASPNWPAPIAATAGGDAFVHAAAASVDAVVHVQTASLVADQSNPWISMLGMAAGRIAQGSGSGVLVDESGVIVTNHHVIQGAREVRVNTSDGKSHVARVVGSDPSTDLAVLAIKADRPLPAMTLGNSDEVQVGEWVLAVGNPLNLTSTVTAGIVSAKGRNIRLLEADASREVFPVESFLQTDAAVNPGNSGGALVNLEGQLIGINTAIASQTGSYAGYSFAIPSSIVAKVVQDIREFGRVQRAYMGIQVRPREPGVVVASTSPGGGAREAGIEVGDRILAINGLDVGAFPSLQEQLSKHRPGDEVRVTVQRGQTRRVVVVTLTNRQGASTLKPPSSNAELPKAAPRMKQLEAAWGVALGPVPNRIRENLQLRGGVMVTDLQNGAWARQGIRKGFIVLRIDGSPVKGLQDVARVVARAAQNNEEGLLLEGMYPDGSRGFAGVAVPLM